MLQKTTLTIILFLTASLVACGGSDETPADATATNDPGNSNADNGLAPRENTIPNAQSLAKSRSEQTLTMLKTSQSYVERVTDILATVQDDATATQAIAQIDALADERRTYKDLDLQLTAYGVTADDKAEFDRLKKAYESALPAMQDQLNRIIFSGPGGTAIPKSGPMREVTRAVNVAKPERRG